MSFAMRSQRNLCVAIAGPTMSEALATLAKVEHRTDMVELRLDLIEDYDLAGLLLARRCPAIVTLRPRRQGGAHVGDESMRLAELRRADDLGAEWIDVEIDAAAQLGPLRHARKIVSCHDFTSIPEQPGALMAALWRAGADAAKLAAMVHLPAEVASLLQLLVGASGPSIVLGMGAPGVASRLLCLRYDACLLTYVSAEQGRGTAPGQITLDDAEAIYRVRSIGPGTRVIGFLGPADERSALAAANDQLASVAKETVCIPLGADDARQGLEALTRLGLAGGIVPRQWEARVAQEVPLHGAEAVHRQRVNTLLVRDGRVVGAWAGDLPAQVRLLAPLLR